MKNLLFPEIDALRRRSRDVVALYGNIGNARLGVFDVPHPRTGVTLKVIATALDGWDHVSVSLPNRCPNWPEMEHVKRLFFGATRRPCSCMFRRMITSPFIRIAFICGALTLWTFHVPPQAWFNHVARAP